MPEQLLPPPDAGSEPDTQEPEAEPRKAVDATALRALKSPAPTWRPSTRRRSVNSPLVSIRLTQHGSGAVGGAPEKR